MSEQPTKQDLCRQYSLPWHGVVPVGGWWEQRLRNICNPRRLQWRAYFRACRRIPQGTPCHGSTSWKKINSRRHELISARVPDGHPEFEALQKVASEIGCGGTVADNFVMGRWLRRFEQAVAAELSTLNSQLSTNPRCLPSTSQNTSE